jgi:hypothetical protein
MRYFRSGVGAFSSQSDGAIMANRLSARETVSPSASLRGVAAIAATTLLAASVLLIVQRGGLLAWTGAILALPLLAKILLWPSPADGRASAAVLLLWALAWLATWQYVKHVWESGEVVETRIGPPSAEHTARLWVVDANERATLYYDSPPEIASTLLAGAQITMSRGGSVAHGCAKAVRVSSLPESAQASFLELMNAKYAQRNDATQIFYSVLGSDRSRVPVLMHVSRC